MTWWMWIIAWLAVAPLLAIRVCMRLKQMSAPPADEPIDSIEGEA